MEDFNTKLCKLGIVRSMPFKVYTVFQQCGLLFMFTC